MGDDKLSGAAYNGYRCADVVAGPFTVWLSGLFVPRV